MSISIDIKGYYGNLIVPKYSMTLNDGKSIDRLSQKQLLNFVSKTLQHDKTAIINCPIELESNIEEIRNGIGSV